LGDALPVRDNQTKPSVICCAPKMRGILAKYVCDGEVAFLIDATYIPVSKAPAPKLALAEKHIRFIF
jgi:hypothetical protein